MNEPIRFIELFAGIGGFRYGLERCMGTQSADTKSEQTESEILKRGVGTSMEVERSVLSTDNGGKRSVYTCVCANEIDKYAAGIYRRNYGEGELYEGDITKVRAEDIPDHDLLVGGFPCQAFSIAGKRGGFEDTRGTLFFEIARIAQKKRPRLLLLENVKGLLSADKGWAFGTILATLDEIGYDCQWEVLNSKNFGVPQNRERVFIIGHLRGTSRPEVFPIGGTDRIDKNKSKCRKRGNNLVKDFYCVASRGRNPSNPSDRTTGSPTEQRLEVNSQGTTNALTNVQKDNWLLANSKIRRLTPTECERLQGFPDGWTKGVSDTQRYKCLGNAVTTNVITAIGVRLIKS